MGKRSYGIYNKFDVVYADFGRNPHHLLNHPQSHLSIQHLNPAPSQSFLLP